MKNKFIALTLCASLSIASVTNLQAADPVKESPSIAKSIINVGKHTLQTVAGLCVTLGSISTLTMAFLMRPIIERIKEQTPNLTYELENQFDNYGKFLRNYFFVSSGILATTGITCTSVGIQGLVKDISE